MRYTQFFAFALLLTFSQSAIAADPIVAIDIATAQADPDFALQGEYLTSPDAAQSKGVQVVALGNGQFRTVIYEGGLPGDGGIANRRKSSPKKRPNQRASFSMLWELRKSRVKVQRSECPPHRERWFCSMDRKSPLMSIGMKEQNVVTMDCSSRVRPRKTHSEISSLTSNL